MDKKLNLKTGKLGEETAAKFLEKKGYKIISRNFKTRYSEIDLIAREKNSLVFIEVRTRVGEEFGLPEETLNKEKKRRLKRAAEAFAAFNKWKGSFRIDAVCVVLDENQKAARISRYENIC